MTPGPDIEPQAPPETPAPQDDPAVPVGPPETPAPSPAPEVPAMPDEPPTTPAPDNDDGPEGDEHQADVPLRL